MEKELRFYSTFRIGGTAHAVFHLETDEDIRAAHRYALERDKKLVVIGEGSNSIFAEAADAYVVGRMRIRGINAETPGDCTRVTAGGGESWDGLVEWATQRGLSGIEALSWIPGTVGAAPVQNIGAYGSEIADTLVSVRAFDRRTEMLITLSREDCSFAYRDSVFKRNPERYVITHVTLSLRNDAPSIPQYASLPGRFAGTAPTVQDIRSAVIEIRTSKLPDVRDLPNCGSFFKNPVITADRLQKIRRTHPDIPFFEIDTDTVKLYAGWLIEHADYRSCETSAIRFYEKNKLVPTNRGAATFDELERVIACVIQNVSATFGITLEVEPNLYR